MNHIKFRTKAKKRIKILKKDKLELQTQVINLQEKVDSLEEELQIEADSERIKK